MSLVIGPSSLAGKELVMMGKKGFSGLRVYRLSEEIAGLAWESVNRWPNLAKDTVGKQLIRAADSIGANIAEGTGRGSFQDNRKHVRIARGSLYETSHWLRRAYRRNLLKPDQTRRLHTLVQELGPRLNAYLKSIGRARIVANQGASDQGPGTKDT